MTLVVPPFHHGPGSPAFAASPCSPSGTAQTQPPAASETVVLPTFSVSTSLDQGYRAGNSVSATRIDTPIKDLPFTLSAFTDQFINDIGARELPDIAVFRPGRTSARRSSWRQHPFSIRGFDGDTQPPAQRFRRQPLR